MIGIYKIISPSNRIYIGQSVDIERRFNQYKKYIGKGQNKVENSFKKYGIDKHIFEVIEECLEDQLNERERYWQDHYDVLNGGLNCRLTTSNDKSGRLSEETKNKMTITRTGKKLSESHCKSIGNIHRGKTISDNHKKKISEFRTGKKDTEEIREKKSMNNARGRSKVVLNIQTGIFYDTIKEAAASINYSRAGLSLILNGKRNNNTNLILV